MLAFVLFLVYHVLAFVTVLASTKGAFYIQLNSLYYRRSNSNSEGYYTGNSGSTLVRLLISLFNAYYRRASY